jgi:hypothetical protein
MSGAVSKLIRRGASLFSKNAPAAVDYGKSIYRAKIVKPPAIALTPSQAPARLNVLLPHFYKEDSFGGIRSAMELVFSLSRHYEHVRFISSETLKTKKALFDFASFVDGADRKTVTFLGAPDVAALECHPNEIFFCTWWPTVLTWEAYNAALASAGLKKNPLYRFIQDYEASFYPFGYEQALINRMNSYEALTHAVVNSEELQVFLKNAGHRFAREYVVRPSLDGALYRYLKNRDFVLKPKPAAPLQIFIYGRPKKGRNCFASIVEGLHLFFKAMPEPRRKDFRVVSAGEKHPDIRLAPGITVKSVGKLSMNRYIETLEASHIGVSLMQSPHPSYPPIEMAVFGLYTITNKYFNKDLTGVHPNFHCIDYPLPDELAQALDAAAAAVARGAPAGQKAVVPQNFSAESWRDNMARLDIDPAVSSNLA